METDELERAIEAVLLVAVEPITPGLLAELFEEPVERIDEAIDRLAQSYEAEHRGFQLARIAGGVRYQTHPDLATYVERFANRDVSHRLSTAALETLAIVAYRQPVSRGQISALRGVNVDGVARLLEQRGYIEVVGRAEGPGQPVLYGTTDLFLERLGLNDLEQLPPVEDFLPGPEVAGELEARFRGASPSLPVADLALDEGDGDDAEIEDTTYVVGDGDDAAFEDEAESDLSDDATSDDSLIDGALSDEAGAASDGHVLDSVTDVT